MSNLGFGGNSAPAQFCNPKLTQAAITTGVVAVASAAVGLETTIVELWSSVDGFYAVGATPVATAASIRIRADVVRTINITPGHKVSFILASGTGTAEVTEMV